MEGINPHPRRRIASSRFSDTSSRDLGRSSSSDQYSSLLAGNLLDSPRHKPTWPWQSFFWQSSSSRLLSMHGKTGLPQGSWPPSRPCFPKIRCWCETALKLQSPQARLFLEIFSISKRETNYRQMSVWSRSPQTPNSTAQSSRVSSLRCSLGHLF